MEEQQGTKSNPKGVRSRELRV